jgi:hypothetical protein
LDLKLGMQGSAAPARLTGAKALAVFHFGMGAMFSLPGLWLAALVLGAAPEQPLLLLLPFGLSLVGLPDFTAGWGLLRGKRYGWWLAAALEGARLVGGILALVGFVLYAFGSLSPYITIWDSIGSILTSSGLFLTSGILLLLRAPFPALMAAAQLNVLVAALALWYLYRPHVKSAFEAGAEAAETLRYRPAEREPEEHLSSAETAAPTAVVEEPGASAQPGEAGVEAGGVVDEVVARGVALAVREMIEKRARLRCELREEGDAYVLEIEAGSRASDAVGGVRVYGMEIRVSGGRCVVLLPKRTLATAGKGFGALRSFGLAERDVIELYAESYAKKIVSIAKAVWM